MQHTEIYLINIIIPNDDYILSLILMAFMEQN